MDKDTRNAIERATQRARRLIEDDFASQLEGTFDVLRNGTIALKPGSHLVPRQVFQRDKIVAALEHKRAAGMSAPEAVTDYLRDAAFTTLNRFVALKMLEARELLQQCISKGELSVGYREFCGMAPGIAILPESAGYRLYIESLFDELSTEVKTLFDRRDAASVLWLKRATFEYLLEVLNATELSGVWGEEETIGWVYQFFNTPGDRREARYDAQGKPKAPQNSRELAVRNQFFTPRYVVQFLADNTLGRIWYEMHDTTTALAERCEYMVRPGREDFAPRPKKDPRDLRILDPACGSGHFLLYCFDLLLTIYEEAWFDSGVTPFSVTGRNLRQDYADIEALRRALPGLIVEHNLYGVDIDPRAAQIAPLALWMRAQRAWRDYGVSAAARPRVRYSHIVVAEPMPGDTVLVEEFATRLDPPFLGDLFRKMVGEMRLAGELGTLIPIEDDIAAELRLAREQFVKQRQSPAFLPGMEPTHNQGELDISGIDDDNFFHDAEAKIVEALRVYAETAPKGASVRRRLFAGDAAQGIALIDLLRTRFDVVLMNPPFGDPTPDLAVHLDRRFPRTKYDLGAAFIERATELCASNGQIGWISSRTWMASAMLEAFRSDLLYRDAPLALVADLGIGVLDSALVETAACTASLAISALSQQQVKIFRLLASKTKEIDLLASIKNPASEIRLHFDKVRRLPRSAFGYWFPEPFFEALGRAAAFEPSIGTAKQGLATTDDFRFLRCLWEVRPTEVGWKKRWVPFAKGGEYEPYYDDIHLVIDWMRDGAALKDYLVMQKGQAHWSRRIASAEYYGRSGLTYPERTTSDFSPRPLPTGAIFSATGQAVFFNNDRDRLAYLGLAYTRIFKQLIELFVGGGDASESGSAARHYTSGILNEMPVPRLDSLQFDVPDMVSKLINARREELSGDEVSIDFVAPALAGGTRSLKQSLENAIERYLQSCLSILRDAGNLEMWACKVYGLPPSAAEDFLSAEVCRFPTEYPRRRQIVPSELRSSEMGQLVASLCERRGYRRAYTKKSYWSNRFLELSAHYFEEHPENCSALPIWKVSRSLATPVKDLMMYSLGCIFGRWDLCYATGAMARPPFSDAFTELPRCAPGRLQTADGLPVTANTEAVACVNRPLVFWDGVAVDDEGHPRDVVAAIEAVLRIMWPEVGPQITQEVAEALDETSADLRGWLRQELFSHHLSRYTRSRRKAPIYWQLATPSCRYSVWIYVHSATSDAFYKIQNEFVGPKLAHEEGRLETMRRDFGPRPSGADRRELIAQETSVAELREFLDEIRRVAPLWIPSLNDGVVIAFAPLWRLVPNQNAWQKELYATWNAICAGEYDWAHLAMHLWPERVVPKCTTDRSLAIAHGLEDVFWVEDFNQRWRAIGSRDEERDHVARHWAALPLCKVIQTARELWEQRYRDSGRRDHSWWQDVEAGAHDDHLLALLVWPERVCRRAFEEPQIAAAHGFTVPKQSTGLDEDKERLRYEWVQKLLARYVTVPDYESFLGGAFSLLQDAETWQSWWKRFDGGELDHRAVAHYLRPTAVAERCQNNLNLAIAHGVERFFFVDRGAGLSARLEAAEELAREVAERTSPAVKAALSNLMNAPITGAKTRDRSRGRASPTEVGGSS